MTDIRNSFNVSGMLAVVKIGSTVVTVLIATTTVIIIISIAILIIVIVPIIMIIGMIIIVLVIIKEFFYKPEENFNKLMLPKSIAFPAVEIVIKSIVSTRVGVSPP